ncbi:LOW QUALITY PROTEIN: cytochrome P450 71AU50-like [Rutidosis leptorrhynchoides]|uniref:LOW QUALITY PROTEIN: cytochrome P450 71AU50-like n=1 Tax=Rutidosis leptorrhynchoides TaxID=125765 RepID=UPI003A998ABD
MEYWTWTTFAAMVLMFFLKSLILNRNTKKSRKLPPGPRGFPILGSLHLLGKYPQRDFHSLAKKYGPIMHMRLGLVPTIIVSSPRAAELFLKTHDLNFASRPHLEAGKYISYGRKNFTFAQYGSYWRQVRKMCTLELLSSAKINSSKPVRKEEITNSIRQVKEFAKAGSAVDLSAKISSLSADMTCRIVFGKKYEDKAIDERGFKAVVQESMTLAGIPNVGEYIPPIASLDLQGLTKRMKAIHKVFDAFFEKIINEHVENNDENRRKDFVDVMLGFMGNKETEYHIERDHIKAIILDMLVAAMDTSATAVEWAVSNLMKHPRIMNKVQKELEDKIGLDRMVEESDLENLDYLNLVIKETLRLHPPTPMLLPHEALDDCIVDGFYIPKKSRVIINAWAIGRDPNAWADAEKFIPERFEGSNIDVRGRDFQLIPFGSGRRSCPGMQLGLTVVRYMVAQLVHCFKWELPDNMLPADLDMTEEFSLVTPRAKPLLAIPTYRLNV